LLPDFLEGLSGEISDKRDDDDDDEEEYSKSFGTDLIMWMALERS